VPADHQVLAILVLGEKMNGITHVWYLAVTAASTAKFDVAHQVAA
jgi:hypothetical protein